MSSDMESDKSQQKENLQSTDRDLSEQIKTVTKDSHVRAENTELMLSYQRGQITLPQYKLLLCSLYEIYKALEEELDRNSSHPGVAPIYFPQELARLQALERDLEYVLGQDWRERVIVPAATHRYTQRLRQIGGENPVLLVAHAYTRYLGDLSGGQVLGRITQKSMGLRSGEGLSFFSFPGVTSPHRFKQLYRSRMNSIELTEEQREGVLQEAVRAFEFNIEVFDDLQKMLRVTETDAKVPCRLAPDSARDAAHDVEAVKNRLTEEAKISSRDLSEQIKTVTKDSHVRAENTELMLSYQRGQITLPQYKLLLCSLYEIYKALEEELDRNSSHPGVAPIYFPQELARLQALERDLEYVLGQDWRERVIVPAATHRYTQRLRQIGGENHVLLVAHAYTRYLGDLSGGQVLGRITQKSMGLRSGEGLSFFSFPGVTSPHRFKQLYRSRMNSIELTEEQREGVLQEAVRAFEFNIEVFDDLQKMLMITEETGVQRKPAMSLNGIRGHQPGAKHFQVPASLISASPVLGMVLGACVALAVAMALYAL
ncbi:heme oxygenase 1a isoform X1 [Megalops cyprinoides]|uniref:heme oxygenase 1a isoform X1 n=2 Tax=Megalops cyprinoides TaxID=118141 RepID=UPI0018642591|nr:heme oxygenase 1a isoform X1 [Megalops cyprinoides]